MQREAPPAAPSTSGRLRWGVLVGLVIAVVDTASVAAARQLGAESDAAHYIAVADQVINVALFSILGLRVGRATRVPRLAAEAGVMAGAIAGVAAVIVTLAMPLEESPSLAREIVGILALNVAMGGVLALVNGWLGSRVEPDRRTRTR